MRFGTASAPCPPGQSWVDTHQGPTGHFWTCAAPGTNPNLTPAEVSTLSQLTASPASIWPWLLGGAALLGVAYILVRK
jgi:hypothetical protein